MGDGAEDDFCEKCFKATDGSPLDTVELAIELGRRKLKGTRDDLPAMRDIASAVSGPGLIKRLQALGTTTVRFAQAAAVLGAPFSPELAATIAVIGSEDTTEAIEKLRVARIVADGHGPGGSLDFVHSLIATTIYRNIQPASFRVGMHNAAAEAVRAAGFSAAKTSRHLLELPCEGRPEVVECLREAAREFLRAGAPEAARRVLARALQEPPLPEDRAVLLHELIARPF